MKELADHVYSVGGVSCIHLGEIPKSMRVKAADSSDRRHPLRAELSARYSAHLQGSFGLSRLTRTLRRLQIATFVPRGVTCLVSLIRPRVCGLACGSLRLKVANRNRVAA